MIRNGERQSTFAGPNFFG